MPRPKYESWFMEGRLQPGVHYIEIKDDYSDLEDKIQYYSTHVEEAEAIIRNAHAFVEQFRDKPKSRRKTPRNPVRSRSFKLKVRETHGLFIDSNSAPII